MPDNPGFRRNGTVSVPRPAPRRSILYQRGIYPPEAFTPVSKYGLSILVTSDEGLKTYLVQVLRQLSGEAHGGAQVRRRLASSYPGVARRRGATAARARPTHASAAQRGCPRARSRSSSSSSRA